MTKPYRPILSMLAGAVLVAAQTVAFSQTTQSPSSPPQSGSGAGSMSSGTSSDTNSSGGTTQSSVDTTTVTVPMVVLVPVEVQTTPMLNNGCWVRLTDKDATPKKGNDILTILGRMSMPSLQTPSGINWSRKADSLTVGPHARVTVFSDSDYKGSAAKLNGGQQINDINKELKFVKSIDSLQVDCTA